MTDRVQPVEAWAAVSPEGEIMTYTVCSTEEHTRGQTPNTVIYADGVRDARLAPGWRVIRVRIVPVEGGDG